LGRKGKWEYFRVIYGRYGKADRKAKREMLNEFCLTTGYHRKYAIRILNGPAPGKRPNRPVRKRGLSYGHELLSVLTSVWEAAGYPWSVRLKALLPAWMPWIRKRRRKGCGKDARFASLEIPSGFPLSHSHNNNKPSTVTYQMARRGALGLHF